jgi:peptide/nickel transport system substrate-binding protein
MTMAYGSDVSRLRRVRPGRAAALIGVVGLLAAIVGTLSASPGFATSRASAGKITPKHGGTLTIGENAIPIGLDPTTTIAASSWEPIGLIYSGLLRWSPDMKIEPDLATSYDNPNPTTFVFHLRKGVTFQNGQRFTAADVKYTFDRILDPATASPLAGEYSEINAVTVVNPYTVKFSLKEASPSLLSALATVPDGMIVPRGVADLVTHPVGTGPFTFVSYQPNQQLVLKANPHFYEKGLPYLSGVVMKYFGDQSSILSAIRSGSVDMTWLSDPKVAATVGARPKMSGQTWPVWLKLNQPPLNDYRVRRALSLATNRQGIIDTVLGRANGKLSGLIPSAELGGDKNPAKDLHFYNYNLTEAKKLLAEAGYPNGLDLGNFDVNGNAPQDVQVVQILQQQWAAAGIKVNVNPMPPADLIKAWHAGNFTVIALQTKVLPDPDVIAEKVRSTNALFGQAWGFHDTKMDSMIDAARSELNPKKRTADYLQIQKRIADQAYAIIVFQTPGLWELWRNYVRGYTPSILNVRTAVRTTWLNR